MQLDFQIWGASSNLMAIICPLVGIGLTELLNSGKAKAHPAQPLAASLHRCNSESVSGLSIFFYENNTLCGYP